MGSAAKEVLEEDAEGETSGSDKSGPGRDRTAGEGDVSDESSDAFVITVSVYCGEWSVIFPGESLCLQHFDLS